MAFDPDAYLASKTGGASPPAAPGGFDPDAYLAAADKRARLQSRHEQLTEDIKKLQSGPSETGPMAYLRAGAGALADKATAIGRGIREVATHPIATLTEAPRRREFLRGVDDTVTFGYGQKLAGHIDEALPAALRADLTPEERRAAGWDRSPVPSKLTSEQQADAQAAPDVRTGGSIAGAFIPGGAANLAGRGAARVAGAALPAAKAAGAIGGAGRAALTYELAAPAISAAHASNEGHRLEAAADAAFDPTNIALSTAAGAAGGRIASAPARAEASELKGLTEGVQYKTRVQKFVPNEADIRTQLRTEPKIRSLIKTDPVKAQPLVERMVGERADATLEPFYRQMAATGQDQIPVSMVTDPLKAVRGSFNKVGEKAQIAAIDDYIASLEAEAEANGGKLPAQFVRETATSIQKQGFASTPMFGQVPLSKAVKQDVGNALRGAVADHLESLTPDTASGKALREAFASANREVSTWYRIQDIVDEKATRIRGNASATGDVVHAVASAIKHPGGTLGKLALGALPGASDVMDRRVFAPLAPATEAIGSRLAPSPITAGTNPVLVARQAEQDREQERARWRQQMALARGGTP
jgi:hypothetical protein